MRRTIFLLTAVTTALLGVSGIAWAVTKDCRAGAEYCIGTDNPDTLNGSGAEDKIYGLKGDDTLLGNEGFDVLRAGGGFDRLKGNAGDDNLYGQAQKDALRGGSGDDELYDASYNIHGCIDDRNVLIGGRGEDTVAGWTKLYGGAGNDELDGTGTPCVRGTPMSIRGGAGTDRIRSGGFDDTINARDGERDTVSCGSGEDTVYFDKGTDSVNPITCEHRRGR
jgi:Ca2+-binding RTX toxin-like protein